MAKPRRKTIPVDALVAAANRMLAAREPTAQERASVCSVLESVLMEADAYRGFRYLSSDELPEGVPGFRLDPEAEFGRVIPDDTRRRYY